LLGQEARIELIREGWTQMAVARATALFAAVLGVMMFAGVRSNVSQRAAPTTAVTVPQLAKELTPLLNQPVKIDLAEAGFLSAEDFAATVHASRNIRVPFTVLKRQVVDNQKTLVAAIEAVKPSVDASLEADLARSEARADLKAIK
jgi:hypothetical protein